MSKPDIYEAIANHDKTLQQQHAQLDKLEKRLCEQLDRHEEWLGTHLHRIEALEQGHDRTTDAVTVEKLKRQVEERRLKFEIRDSDGDVLSIRPPQPGAPAYVVLVAETRHRGDPVASGAMAWLGKHDVQKLRDYLNEVLDG